MAQLFIDNCSLKIACLIRSKSRVTGSFLLHSCKLKMTACAYAWYTKIQADNARPNKHRNYHEYCLARVFECIVELNFYRIVSIFAISVKL